MGLSLDSLAYLPANGPNTTLASRDELALSKTIATPNETTFAPGVNRKHNSFNNVCSASRASFSRTY